MAHKNKFHEIISGNIAVSIKISSGSSKISPGSSDPAPTSNLSKVIVVRGITTDKISFPFDYTHENERRENLLANMGPDPSPSSTDHVE
jgi:hypothetical protein